MDGRAFGAPLRSGEVSRHSARDFGGAGTENSSSPNLIVEALPVQQDEDVPVVYADTSPLSVT
jgi:hypothetical protein